MYFIPEGWFISDDNELLNWTSTVDTFQLIKTSLKPES